MGAALLTSLSIITPIVEQQKIQQAKDAQQSQIEAEQQVQLRAQEQAKYEAEKQIERQAQLQPQKLTTLISPEWHLRMPTLIEYRLEQVNPGEEKRFAAFSASVDQN